MDLGKQDFKWASQLEFSIYLLLNEAFNFMFITHVHGLLDVVTKYGLSMGQVSDVPGLKCGSTKIQPRSFSSFFTCNNSKLVLHRILLVNRLGFRVSEITTRNSYSCINIYGIPCEYV